MLTRLLVTVVGSLFLAACSVDIAGGGNGGGGGGSGSTATHGDTTGSGTMGGGTAGGGGAGTGTGTTSSGGWVPPAGNACARTGADPGTGDVWARLQYGFAATWSGTATAPSGWTTPSWQVWARFGADGTYSAHSLDPSVPALYYGSDDDVPGKTYTLDDIQASGMGVGTIQVYFFENDWNTGDLKHIALSEDLSGMTFEFWKDGYGPVVFDLHCVP
jgi:hypothetical protein